MKQVFTLMLILSITLFAQTKKTYEYVSPLPGSELNSRETSLIFRTGDIINPASLTGDIFSVKGNISGEIGGTVILSDDGKTLIFKPSQKYAPGETVSVEIKRSALGAADKNPVAYNFKVTPLEERVNPALYLSEVNYEDLPRKTLNMKESDPLPDDFPKIRTELYPENGDPAEGYVFLTVSRQIEGVGYFIMMLNNDGTPFFYKRMEHDYAYDFKKQPNGWLTYAKLFEHHTYTGGGNVVHMALDNSLTVVDSFQMGNGYVAEAHGFRILPNGHALLFGYDLQKVDMTSYGGYPDAMVAGSVVQELDQDKNVVFQWRSWDHYPAEEYLGRGRNTRSAFDPIHFNSIYPDYDGHILISSNGLGEVTKINRQTGEIIWRLGGPSSDFTFVDSDGIDGGVHNVSRLDNGHILFFDNPTPQNGLTGRAVEYALDMDNMTATLVWKYEPDDESIFAHRRGSAQRLPNGNTIVGWGSNSDSDSLAATEVTADGKPVFRLWYEHEGMASYRAFRYTFDAGAPAAEYSEYEVLAGNTYDFGEGTENDLGIDIKINSMTGAGYNELSGTLYNYAPEYPQFFGKAPMAKPVRVVLDEGSINTIAGEIRFDTEFYDVKNPEDIVVYHREFEGTGLFQPLITTYVPARKEVVGEFDKLGEFILTWPDFESIVYTPVPFAPQNDTLVNRESSVDIRWRPIGYVEEYTLQVATDSEFSSLVVDEEYITEAIYTMDNLEDNTTYYWRAKAYNDAGESEWSEVYEFTSAAPYIELTSPEGGEDYQVGESYFITWEDNLDEDVNLYIDNESMSEPLLLGTEPSTGGFKWEVDVAVEPGTYNVIIESSVNGDISVTSAAISVIDTASAVEEHEFEQVTDYALLQNYPNPFNPSTKIDFRMPEAGNVSLKVYDLLGREVATLIDGYKNAGSHTVTFDASSLSSGIYFYSLEAGKFSQKRKMLLMK